MKDSESSVIHTVSIGCSIDTHHVTCIPDDCTPIGALFQLSFLFRRSLRMKHADSSWAHSLSDCPGFHF
jgi:hypothetical protein